MLKPTNDDVYIGKYTASDGVGVWASLLGGSDDENLYDMTMGPHGPLLTGYALSDIMIGEVHVQNLQQDLEKSYRSMFAVQLSADAQPACFSSCGADVSTAVIKDGFCYSDSKCVANGAMSVSTPCFQCDSDVSQKELQGPITDNHCYINEKCVEAGKDAPAYNRYGSPR